MPIQAPQWTEFLSCPICCHEFDSDQRGPISLGCGHTVCRGCLAKLQRNQCPYDQTIMRLELDQLPVNGALLSLVNHSNGSSNTDSKLDSSVPTHPPPAVPIVHAPHYFSSVQCIKELALLLKPFSNSGLNGSSTSMLSRPMQRKLVTLINCQLVEEEGRARAVRAARSLGERTVTELILHHQNHHQLSANLWAAVRSRGCQFLGPAMQEEVLKLVLLALEDGSALSRKVLVMFVVQRLEPHFPQASKTSIGHVVQLLYRASCFKVSKREGDSSLMQLKEEFRTYEALRREHDAQIVQIATEAGLRIAPDQWSSLLYGDTAHKSHMQSIIDKLQTPQSFGQSVQELVIALQRTGDPGHLSSLRPQLELLAGLDPSPDSAIPGWELCSSAMDGIKGVVLGLVQFIQHHGNRKITDAHHAHNAKYKTSMCRDLTQRGGCPRGNDCTFAHSEDELEKFRSRNRKPGKTATTIAMSNSNYKNSVPLNNGDQKHFYGDSFKYNSSMNSPNHQKREKIYHHSNNSLTPPPSPQVNHHSSPAIATTSNKVRGNSHSHPMEQVYRNGDIPPPMRSMIGKHVMVEEVLTPVMGHQNMFDGAPKFVQTARPTLPVLQGSLRPNLNPQPPPPTQVFAAPIQEYAAAYGAFHHGPGPIFANPNLPPGGIAAIHAPPPQGGPSTPVFSPQHPPSLLQEMFTPNHQAVLVNQGQLYNLVTPARDYNGSVAETQQTSALASKSVLSSWPENPLEHFERSSNNDASIMHNIDSSSAEEILASKSLNELKERKDEILFQLGNIVGKEAIDEVATQIENGESVPTSSPQEFSSTYSIWTSGADFSNNFNWGKKPEKGTYDPTLGYRTNPETDQRVKVAEDFVPFDPPIHSRFGPISRMTNRPFMHQTNTIQVSACSTADPVTTPTVHRPVPAISPMPQMLYPHPGFAVGLVSYPPTLEYMNTIGHGIIDPPHLHMSQLEPSGSRPSDPIMEFVHMGQEERQRQHFIAAKEGMDNFCLSQKVEEIRLKEELNLVLHGINEKKKEIELGHGDNNNQCEEEDMTDFEKNWNFDFDEGDKD